MGRHSGAVCKACQRRILVRDGRFIEHRHEFPMVGRSLICVGSHTGAPDDWGLRESLNAGANLVGGGRPDPVRAC